MITAIRSMPSFVAVADRQNFALEVDPVFKPVVNGYCFSNLLVLFNVNFELPCLVSWVMSSIQIPVYSNIFGYFTVSSLDMTATSIAVV